MCILLPETDRQDCKDVKTESGLYSLNLAQCDFNDPGKYGNAAV